MVEVSKSRNVEIEAATALKPFVVVGIPAFNEEKTIARVILQSQKYADKVVVCDDGCSDLTGEIARRLGADVVRHETNLGKGAALRSLFNAGRKMGADAMVTLDADAQHVPDEIPRLLKLIFKEEADMVIGCRSMPSNAPASRRWGNRILNFFTNMSMRNGNGNGKSSDTQSGFRAYSKKALAAINVIEDGLGVDSQILLDAAEKNLRISEVPVSTNYPKNIKTSKKEPIHHGFEVLLSIIELATEKRPLVFLGIPGSALLTVGGTAFVIVLKIFNETRQFAIGTAMLGIVSTLLGAMLAFGSVILWMLGNRFHRLENRLSNHD